MKKLTLTSAAILFTLASFAGDILTLNNNMIFEGKVISINGCDVHFVAGGKKFILPASKITSVQFENANDKVYTDYMKLTEGDPNPCLQGSVNAEN